LHEPAAIAAPINVMQLLFDPRLCRPYVADWERVAKAMLSRLQREHRARAPATVPSPA
jgi:hypothetical protein